MSNLLRKLTYLYHAYLLWQELRKLEKEVAHESAMATAKVALVRRKRARHRLRLLESKASDLQVKLNRLKAA